jgi:hypothetical protein
MLNIVKRICLIKSILNSLPLFYMSVFLVPKVIIRSISAIIRRFLWSSNSNTFKLCKVA